MQLHYLLLYIIKKGLKRSKLQSKHMIDMTKLSDRKLHDGKLSQNVRMETKTRIAEKIEKWLVKYGILF